MNRRALLANAGALATVGLAGCAASGYAPENPPTKLAWLAVANHDEAAGHEFDFRVERDGEVVHESSHAVERKPEGRIPGAAASCTWDDVAGQYVVSVRCDDGEWVESKLAAGFDRNPACVVARAHYGDFGSDELWIRVTDRCDEVAGYKGGCSAYKSPSGDDATPTANAPRDN